MANNDDNNDGAGSPLFTFVDENIFKKETFLGECTKSFGLILGKILQMTETTAGFSRQRARNCLLHNCAVANFDLTQSLLTYRCAVCQFDTTLPVTSLQTKAFSSTHNLLMTSVGRLHKHRACRVHCAECRKTLPYKHCLRLPTSAEACYPLAFLCLMLFS